MPKNLPPIYRYDYTPMYKDTCGTSAAHECRHNTERSTASELKLWLRQRRRLPLRMRFECWPSHVENPTKSTARTAQNTHTHEHSHTLTNTGHPTEGEKLSMVDAKFAALRMCVKACFKRRGLFPFFIFYSNQL